MTDRMDRLTALVGKRTMPVNKPTVPEVIPPPERIIDPMGEDDYFEQAVANTKANLTALAPSPAQSLLARARARKHQTTLPIVSTAISKPIKELVTDDKAEDKSADRKSFVLGTLGSTFPAMRPKSSTHATPPSSVTKVASVTVPNTNTRPSLLRTSPKHTVPLPVDTPTHSPLERAKLRAAENKRAREEYLEDQRKGKDREVELIESIHKKKANAPDTTEVHLKLPTGILAEDSIGSVLKGKSDITLSELNEEQLRAVKLAELGESFCLIGPAGSGKTTVTKMIATTLQESGDIHSMSLGGKHIPDDVPSIVFVSFTNQAVTNIREAVPEDFKKNCLTIHKLLEFAPEFFEIPDNNSPTGWRNTMRYIPTRNEYRPLRGITHVVIEEAGSVDLRLFDQLMQALPPHVILILLGDLNQLPPVFGDAILGFKLLELPVVELQQSYRTDKTSPIRLLAYKILEGKPMTDKEVLSMQVDGELEFVKFKDRVESEAAIKQMGLHMADLIRRGEFDFENDVVLTPYGKSFGTIELNKYMAQAITEESGVPTYEINTGLDKKYMAVGDIVYLYKNKWRVVSITDNPNYVGTKPQLPSTNLNRWGHNTDHAEAANLIAIAGQQSIEDMFNSVSQQDIDSSNEVAFHQASHEITLEDLGESLEPVVVSQCGDISDMYLAYALTVHKAQGSEWDRVYCIFHHSQAAMMKREILYTATTRPRKFCKIFYSGEDSRPVGIRKQADSTFQKGIKKQYIPGNCLADKLEYFKKKIRGAAIQIAAKNKIKLTQGAVDKMDLSDPEEAKQLLLQITHGNKENTI